MLKHQGFGPLLEVAMSKKCTPLWREAHLQVKMLKTPGVRTTFGSCDVEKVRASTFPSQMYKTHQLRTKAPHVRATFGGSDVQKVHAVVARRTFRSKNVKNTRGSDHFWSFRCRFASLHYTTLHYTPQHYNYNYTTTLHYTPLHQITLHYTTLNYTTLHYITLHCIPLHYITLHYTTFHYTSLHYITLHSTTLQLQLHNYTPLH